ncbi:hypothetical protein BaRGS_00036388 [Batillaria attramentaria]|uniref:Uncharacterized protein n=1 Tax=Batillaria attramentaria TaxID=370345 RepID=A0ABD0JC23_9CAEN
MSVVALPSVEPRGVTSSASERVPCHLETGREQRPIYHKHTPFIKTHQNTCFQLFGPPANPVGSHVRHDSTDTYFLNMQEEAFDFDLQLNMMSLICRKVKALHFSFFQVSLAPETRIKSGSIKHRREAIAESRGTPLHHL